MVSTWFPVTETRPGASNFLIHLLRPRTVEIIVIAASARREGLTWKMLSEVERDCVSSPVIEVFSVVIVVELVAAGDEKRDGNT